MPNLKEDAVTNAKLIVAQLPFMSIYTQADTLFGRKALAVGDEELKKEIAFLKNIALEELSYEDIENEQFFIMTNLRTKESIQVSNEDSADGVLIGKTLRELLNSEKEKYPKRSAFDTITEAIRNPKISDSINLLKSCLVGKQAKDMYQSSMSELHFNLFVNSLLSELNKKIEIKSLTPDLDPREIQRDKELQKEIWQGIDVEKIYDLTRDLAKCIELCNNKSEQKSLEGVYTLTILLLNKNEKESELQREILSKANPDLYKEVGTICEKLYKLNFEDPQNAYLDHLCEELNKIPNIGTWGDKEPIDESSIKKIQLQIKGNQLITQTDFSSEINDKDAVQELEKIIIKANAVNRALIAANKVDVTDDLFLQYKNKIHRSITTLEEKAPNSNLSNLDIIKKDRSSLAFRVITGFLAVAAILGTIIAAGYFVAKALDSKERFGTYNLLRSKGHNVQEGILFFKKMKEQEGQDIAKHNENKNEQDFRVF